MTTETPWPLSRLRVSGPDALTFLQGQLTADVETLDADTPGLAAWCNPKGRVITIFRARRRDGVVDLFLPTEIADQVMKRLQMFRFRSKVDFELEDADAGDLGTDLSADAWLQQQLENGLAVIGAGQSEKFTPHMLNLDLHGAVSFDKGCYTGQEVVARTHYRGATKRRLRRFEADASPAPGDKLSNGERDVGEVVNAVGRQFLAVVPDDARSTPLYVDGALAAERDLPCFDAEA